MSASLNAGFIEGSRGRIFVLLRHPAGMSSGPAVLVVPPLAEEMNKCRRMFTEVARNLAARGVATVLPDLYGTGDSEGEFSAADVHVWLDDVVRTAAWSQRQGWQVRGLLCTRIGCVLGARYARVADAAVQCSVFWQPMTDGERFLNQFLRLRVAASMMDADRRESVAGLRDMLKTGHSIEVSGYEVSSQLAAQLDAMDLATDAGPHLGQVHWMEMVRDPAAPLPAPALRCVERFSAAGAPVTVHRTTGEPYWSSTEIVVDKPTMAATVETLAGLNAASFAL